MKIAFVGDSFCMNSGPDPHPYPLMNEDGNVIGFWNGKPRTLTKSEVSKLDPRIQATIKNSNEPIKLLRAEGQYDWPWVVANQLDADIIQSGHGGKHFMLPVIEFLPKMFDADVIIFCVSEPYRMINNYNLPVNMTWVDQMMSKTGDHWENRQKLADDLGLPAGRITKIVEAADGYYKYLFNQTFAEFCQVGFISFIDSLMKEHNKKTIWFPCFTQSFQLPGEYWNDTDKGKPYHKVAGKQYIPISGPSANIPLHELSVAELKYEMNTPEEIEHLIQNDLRRNHFNKENNYKMAKLVLDTIENDKCSLGVIKMEDYFSYMNLDDAIGVRA
jgi:hypothetical protein